MATTKERIAIRHINRILIGVLGIAGMLLNGFQNGDGLCMVSMVIWLWQSECSGLELQLLQRAKQLRTRR